MPRKTPGVPANAAEKVNNESAKRVPRASQQTGFSFGPAWTNRRLYLVFEAGSGSPPPFPSCSHEEFRLPNDRELVRPLDRVRVGRQVTADHRERLAQPGAVSERDVRAEIKPDPGAPGEVTEEVRR